MDVLVVLRGAGDVREVAAGAVLAPLGPGRRAARVHEEQRGLGRHGDRLDHPPPVVREQLVDEEVPAGDHRALRRVPAGVPSPHQHLVDLDALVARLRHRLVGLGLVVDQLAVAVVAVHRHQDVAPGVGDPLAARGTAEPPEHLGVDDAQAGARQHRDGQLGNHRQVEGHAVADLDPGDALQERGELVDPPVELLVGDRLGLFRLRLGHPDERRLVAARGQVAVDAVVTGVQPASDEPLPERRRAGVERRVPVGVPAQQVRVLLEALGEPLLAEPLEDGRVGRVGLRDERRGLVGVVLLAPVHRDLRLGDLRPLLCRHTVASRRKKTRVRSGCAGRRPPAHPSGPVGPAPHAGADIARPRPPVKAEELGGGAWPSRLSRLSSPVTDVDPAGVGRTHQRPE